MGWLYQRRRRRATTGAAGPLVSDTFTRADSALTMGDTETGQAWVTAGTSVWGIATNRAKLVTSGAPDIAYVDAGSANVLVKCTVAVLDNLWNWWLVVRYVDDSNYFKLQVPGSGSDGNFYFTRVTAGSGTDLDSAAIAVLNGDTISIRMSGNDFTIYHNDIEVGSATDAQGNTSELHGIGAGEGNDVQRFDDFIITAV